MGGYLGWRVRGEEFECSRGSRWSEVKRKFGKEETWENTKAGIGTLIVDESHLQSAG